MQPPFARALAQLCLSVGIACGIVSTAWGQAEAGAFRPPTVEEVDAGYRFDRVIAKPKGAVARQAGFAAQAATVHRNLGVKVVKEHAALGRMQTLSVPVGTLGAKIAALKASGLYDYVEPDWIVRTSVAPNDPRLSSGELWGLNNTGQSGGTNDADIDAPEAWNTRHDAPSVIVAVIDTGVRYTHEDIAANMWHNPGESGGGKETNGIDDDGNGIVDDVYGIDAANNDGNPMDDNGHGTHCAGTIAGVGNNGKGVVGVAWQAQIMACKFLAASGSGATSDAISCIDYARNKGAHIMSNSWGGGGYSQALRDSIAAARAAGIVFVAAAGNESANNDAVENFPSNYEEDNVIAVASTTRTDGLSSFSNYGVGLVEIGAPGSEILSLGISSDSDYTVKSGTSMATPHVAGAMALMKAQFPSDTYRQLINRVIRTANPITALQSRTSNAGRLNIQAALTSTVATPFNDDWSGAPILTQNVLNLRGSTSAATVEPAEPVHAGEVSAAASIWWRWTAPGSGNVTVDTSGSAFDTVLAIYTGNGVTGLTPVASNDDASGVMTTSELSFTATSGVTYSIAVAGKSGASGLAMLHLVTPPANDAFYAATTLTGSPVTATGSNRGGSKEPGEPSHAGNVGGHSAWWSWTAPDARTYSVSTTGSSIDTLLAVYTGSAVNALTLVAQNDDVVSGVITSRVNFTSVAGVTYLIAIDGKAGASGNLALEIAAPPANDDFAGRLTVVNSATGTNMGASKEIGEPNHAGNVGGASIWWTWTAPSTGAWEINTQGSSFDTLLGVYTGSAINGLTTVAGNDDGGAGLSSKVSIVATAGMVYQIAVDGYAGDSGTVMLNVLNNVTPPVNDAFAASTELNSGAASVVANSTNATKEAGEPNHAGNSGGASVWWNWTAPSSGSWQVSTAGSNFDTLLGIYTGSSLIGLTEVASDDNSGGSGTSRAVFTAVEGTTYHIAVDGYLGNIGSIHLDVGTPLPPPANDLFADALSLASGPASTTGSNAGAFKEGGEPNHAGNVGGASVWWTWTAPSTGSWRVSTTGSNFDTTLGIYTGSAVGALTAVASDDNSGGAGSSRTDFAAVAGTTYRIAVDGYNGVTGSIVLTVSLAVSAPANNDFADGIVLTAGVTSTTGTNVGADRETGEPNHDGNTGGASVWWRWTAPSTGSWSITTTGSAIDTVMGVYTGATVDALTEIASDDDSGGNATSRVTFTATAGTLYHIAVDGYNGEEGSIALAVAVPPGPPANDHFANRIVLVGSNASSTVDSSLATEEPGEPDHHGRAGGRSAWWSWTAPTSAPVVFNTDGSGFDTVMAVYTGSSLEALTLIGSDDDSGVGNASAVGFTTVAGTTYQIAADGYDPNNGGVLTMNVIFSAPNQPPVAANDSFIGVASGVTTTLSVLANDSDPESQTLAITAISNAPGDATISPNGTTLSFTGGASFASSGINTFTYTISDGHGGQASADVVVYRNANASWRSEHFGAEATNPAVAGDDADPNHNGIPNIIEYALGGDPTGSSTGMSISPQGSRNATSNCMQISFTRLLDRNDVTLTVQASESLTGTWENLAQSVNGAAFTSLLSGVEISETGTGNTRAVIVCDRFTMSDSAHPRRFLRLEVTQ